VEGTLTALAFRNEAVQRLRRLAGRRRARLAEGRFVAEGAKLVHEALRGGARIEAVFLDEAAAGLAERQLAQACEAAGADVRELQSGVLGRACDTVTAQPIAAIVSVVDLSLTELRVRHPDLLVVCASVRDPGNLGTIVRSAAAAGAGGLVCCAGSVDLYNPKTVRATAGALFRLPVVTGPEAVEVLDEVGGWGLCRRGLSISGSESYREVDLTTPTALVLGNEASGLASSLGPHLDATLRVPMARGVESLNVATSASVVCFEAARQRAAAGP
jgi:TrmH family RNA methyltransferase